MRTLLIWTLALALGSAGFLGGSRLAQAHSGHPQFPTLPSRYAIPAPPPGSPQQAWIDWMTLSVDYHYSCGTSCQTTYGTAFTSAVSNWNAGDHTIYLTVYSGHDTNRRDQQSAEDRDEADQFAAVEPAE